MSYNYGPPENFENMMGHKEPLPKDGGCGHRALRLTPGPFRPIVRRLLPIKTPVISEKNLHPSVDRFVTSLLRLENNELEYKARTGIVLTTTFSDSKRIRDSFTANLQVKFNEEQVFSGNLRALGAFTRGKVTFAHTIMGTIELLYLHLLEMAVRDEREIAIRIGVLEIGGSASNLSTIRNVITGEISTTLMRQRDNCDGTPYFDRLTPFGAFPSAGYGYFYGSFGQLVEKKLEASGDMS